MHEREAGAPKEVVHKPTSQTVFVFMILRCHKFGTKRSSPLAMIILAGPGDVAGLGRAQGDVQSRFGWSRGDLEGLAVGQAWSGARLACV